MVLFKGQFSSLARQMYPNRSAFAVEAYKDATREPYSYLFVDLRLTQDVSAPTYFPEIRTTCTSRNERAREKVPARFETHTQTG